MKASVVIPLYNSQNTILEALKYLENQIEKDFEIVAVDDGSLDQSVETIKKYIQISNLRINLIGIPHSGPAHARNIGAYNAKSNLIIFLDSDCLPPNNWLEEMIKPIDDMVAGTTCGYQVKNSESLIARYVGYEIAKRHEKLLGKYVDTMGTYSACYRKDAFEKAGGFNTDYKKASGEDFDLSFKMRRYGYKLKFVGTTFVYHYHPNTIQKYLKQQFFRGYWRVEMYLKNKDKIVSKESYSGFEAQYQFILVTLIFLSLAILYISILPTVILTTLLIASNIPLGIWCHKRERKFLMLAPLIASIRSVTGTLGACFYIINRVLFRRC